MKRARSGFTLVEMAIVLAIIALLLGAGLTLLSVQTEQQRTIDTNALLASANEALTGYALLHTASDGHPYLPCPDLMPGSTPSGMNIANDGAEDRNAGNGACDRQEGNLPWVTLGLSPQTDAWSNRLRYQVSPLFSNSTTGMQLTSSGNLTVLDGNSGNSLASNVPVVILSHGRAGLGAVNATGNTNPNPAVSSDESANTDSNTIFISHAPSPAETAGGYFDDQLIWLSPNILFNRMVQAGKLP